MEALIAIQINLKTNISKGYTNLKKAPKDRITVQYLETRLDLLETQWKSFEENHRNLISKYCPGESDQKNVAYFKSEIYDTVEENYIDYKSSMKSTLASLTKVSHKSLTNETLNTETNAVKLPKITLPLFSGKYMEWPTFHDLFDSLIHQSTSLAKVQKLHYLKSHLTGEAEQLLRHVPITEANYEKCWQQLKKRYSNKRYIANCVLTRLVDQKALTAESSNGVKQLLDTTNDCLNALANLGVETDKWDLIVIHLVNLRLDAESRKQWEHRMSEKSDELPTLQEFNQFLECRFRALEFLEPRERKETKVRDKFEKPNKVFTATTTATSFSCPFCSENHLLYQCKKFCTESFERRHDFVQKQRLCFNCFGTSHPVTKCNKNTACRRCGRRHHSLLHPEGSSAMSHHSEFYSATEPVESDNSEKTEGNNQHISTHLASGYVKSSGQVVLATALVNVEHEGKVYTLRALLDQGSQASFITEHAVQMLGLRKSSIRGVVSGLGGDQLNLSVQYMVKFNLQSICKPFNCDIQAYVLKKLSSTLPAQKFNIHDWSELTGLVLADPGCGIPNKIDILLGADIYGLILLDGILRNSPGNLTAQNTQLGWILSGRIENFNHSANQKVISMHIQDNSTNDLLRKFWELETEQPCNLLSQEDQTCENHFVATTTRDENGRYVVRLPFRDSDPVCQYGDLKSIATRRFLLLEKKLNKDTKLKQEYTKVMNEYVELNHMEAIHDVKETARSDCVYLPHHALVREDKATTKVRVVFDASCKGRNGASLNDDLLIGPRLQPELRHIIMKWRTFPICFIADIVKMYRQVKVHEEDTKYQRLLWRQNSEDDITEYQMLRVTFGVSAAPYLAVKSLQQVAKDHGKDFPMAAERVLRDFYVDDFMSGCDTEQEAVKIHHEVTELLRKAGFQLQKWASNSKRLMNEIQDTRKPDKKLEIKMDDLLKILGLTWDVGEDSFKFVVKLPNATPVTKRSILSDISRLFDPLGWAAPVIIKAIIFMQKLWSANITWDQLIPSDLLDQWTAFRQELQELNRLIVPRSIQTRTNNSDVEIHGFSDASENANAAVIYLRVKNENGTVHVNLITSRTRVAPVKQVSIARLELCGAELLANLLAEVSSIIGVEHSNMHAWTDSTIVLAWLKGQPNRWKTFVANRVSSIQSVLGIDFQWHHVESSKNPADCASRGLRPIELIEHHMWLQGPQWLSEANYNIPQLNIPKTDLEEKRIIGTFLLTADNTSDCSLWSKYSSLQKLVRVVSWCKRFIKILRNKNQNFPSYLTASTYIHNLTPVSQRGRQRQWFATCYDPASDLEESMTACLKHCQANSFSKELAELRKSNCVAKRSRLSSLCPLLDTCGVLRALVARVSNNTLSET